MANSPDTKVLSHIAIRRAIGGLGLILPFGLLIYGIVADAEQPSISHFYYTQAGDILVGCLVAIGVFLLTYLGYPESPDWPSFLPGDRRTSVIAGFGAIGVALFPTAPIDVRSLCEGADGLIDQCAQFGGAFPPIPDILTGWAADTTALHRGAAILFFVPLAYFCLVLFPIGPRGKPERSGELWTYYLCGAIILVCLIVLWRLLGREDADSGTAVFWFEAIAVWAFSVAWLVNGEVLAKLPGFRLSR